MAVIIDLGFNDIFDSFSYVLSWIMLRKLVKTIQVSTGQQTVSQHKAHASIISGYENYRTNNLRKWFHFKLKHRRSVGINYKQVFESYWNELKRGN